MLSTAANDFSTPTAHPATAAAAAAPGTAGDRIDQASAAI